MEQFVRMKEYPNDSRKPNNRKVSIFFSRWRKRGSDGLTYAEVLVALAMMAVLAAGVYRYMRFTVETRQTLHVNIFRNMTLFQLDHAFRVQMNRINVPCYAGPEGILNVNGHSAEFFYIDGNDSQSVLFAVTDKSTLEMTTPEGTVSFNLPGMELEFEPVTFDGRTVAAVLVCRPEKSGNEPLYLDLFPRSIPL
jgi:hypothetical protein